MSPNNNKKFDRNLDICKIHYKRKRRGYEIILLALIVLNASTGIVSAIDSMVPNSITNLNVKSYGTTYINWTLKDPSTYNFSHVMIYIDGKFRTNLSKGVLYYDATGFLPNTWHTISTHTVSTYGGINSTWVNNSARTAKDYSSPASVTTLKNVSYAQSYVNWTWKDPSTYDFSYVMIYIDGNFRANIIKGRQYYNATGFLAHTWHKISTRTVDTSGNINSTWVNSTSITSNQNVPTFRFIAWGDTKGGTNILQSESKSIISKNLNPSFTLYAGDLCSSGPDVTCFDTWKKALNGDVTGATSNGIFGKTFAVRGNHDSSGGSVWQSEFNFNSVSSSIGATNYAEQTADMTYSFDYSNSHFVGVDDACSSLNSCASDITSSQISWLDQDLTNTENRGLKHVFLIWHGPAYTVSAHCCGGISSAMITVLNKHPIVSAGFFGHEHLIEYTHLDSSIIPSLSCSFEQVISGGAGAGLYGLTSGRKVDYYLGNTDGYTMVSVSGSNFDISFYIADGTLMKTLSFTETGTCQ